MIISGRTPQLSAFIMPGMLVKPGYGLLTKLTEMSQLEILVRIKLYAVYEFRKSTVGPKRLRIGYVEQFVIAGGSLMTSLSSLIIRDLSSFAIFLS
jgi:hypothetical protein